MVEDDLGCLVYLIVDKIDPALFLDLEKDGLTRRATSLPPSF